MSKENRLFIVTDKMRANELMEEFDKSKLGGDFWDCLAETIDTTDSIPFLLKLKHRVDELIEDQAMYVLANAAGPCVPPE